MLYENLNPAYFIAAAYGLVALVVSVYWLRLKKCRCRTGNGALQSKKTVE